MARDRRRGRPGPVAAASFRVSPQQAGASLAKALAQWMPERSAGQIADLISRRQVLLNGRNYGTTPREFLLAKGTYRVRATHATLGEREKWIDVPAGGRVRWTVDFDDSTR